MRVNVYAEEMTDRVEIIAKEIDGHKFTGLRFYLELPATVNGVQHQAPFMHRPGDDDSSAVTFWGKRDLRLMLVQALSLLDRHYAERDGDAAPVPAREWIPTPPLKNGRYHVFMSHWPDEVPMADFRDGRWFATNDSYELGEAFGITHYRPLPPPPK